MSIAKSGFSVRASSSRRSVAADVPGLDIGLERALLGHAGVARGERHDDPGDAGQHDAQADYQPDRHALIMGRRRRAPPRSVRPALPARRLPARRPAARRWRSPAAVLLVLAIAAPWPLDPLAERDRGRRRAGGLRDLDRHLDRLGADQDPGGERHGPGRAVRGRLHGRADRDARRRRCGGRRRGRCSWRSPRRASTGSARACCRTCSRPRCSATPAPGSPTR